MMSSLFPDRKALVASQLKLAWEELMPQEILDHTGSIFIANEKSTRDVVVLVDTPMIAAELNARAFSYLVKLTVLIEEKYCEVGRISGLRFKVSRSVSKRQIYKKRDEREPGYIDRRIVAPLTEEDLLKVDETASSIQDEKLQIAFKKAMKANIEWKKGKRPAK